MGYKSRGNYPIGRCFKEDCLNRDLICSSCIRFSNYVTIKMRLKQMGDGKDVYTETWKDLNYKERNDK